MDPSESHELTTAEIVASQSQDYIDEKELEYLQTIQFLADEQERVQKKTFVNWINSCLSQHIPPLRLNDIIEDIRDGTRLIALLEILSGERLPVERGRILRRPHFLSNVNTALQFLERKRVKLVNINASDVVDGRPAVVLGLIWTIILFFQIEEKTRLLGEQMASLQAGSTSSLESAGSPHEDPARRKLSLASGVRSGARKALLQWVKNVIPRKYGINVTDFGNCWRDGYAFLALVSAMRPDLIEWNALRYLSNRARLEMAFDLAEKHLGIARLLDPEDVDVQQPDERSIMTYVAQFLHKQPQLGAEARSSPLDLDQSEYEELCRWLDKAESVLTAAETTLDYDVYCNLRNEMNEKSDLYERIKSRQESKVATYVTTQLWSNVEERWLSVEERLSRWQYRLDANLPPPLAAIAEWLRKAEELLRTEIVPPTLIESDLAFVAAKLQEHNEFFHSLPAIQTEFAAASRSVENVPIEHIEELRLRLERVVVLAMRRRLCLIFEQECLNALKIINQTKRKLQIWTRKYGPLESVEKLAKDLSNYIESNNIFLEFDKTYDKMQKAADAYRKEVVHDAKAVETIAQLLRDVNGQWHSVSVELECLKTMLERLMQSWQTYLNNYDVFEEWLTNAERVASRSEDERIEFFQDLNVWREKYLNLHEAGVFLQSASEEHIAFEIHTKMLNLDQRWEYLLTKVHDYLVAGDLMKRKLEYRNEMRRLHEWVSTAETLVATECTCVIEVLRTLIQQLQALQFQGDEIENLFKSVSKKAQSLIQKVSRDEVDRMMLELKQIKEAIVKLRATIPSRIYLYHQLLSQQEALEQGFVEISQWLEEAESLLLSHSFEGTPEQIRDRLEQHRNFFSRALYYRSMLESKNKIFQSIVSNIGGTTQGIDTRSTEQQLTQINWKFQSVVSSAQIWEQQTEELLRCWQAFREGEKLVNEWLTEARRLFDEIKVDNKSQLDQHRYFFAKSSDHLIQKLWEACEELIRYLPPNQQARVHETFSQLQAKWKEAMEHVPLHLLRLEFRLNEIIFHQCTRELEKELNSEETQFSQDMDFGSLLNQHLEFFERSNLTYRIETCIETMTKISKECTTEEMTLTVQRCEREWEKFQERINDLQVRIKEIPERWNDYRLRFHTLERWMDAVEEAVNKLSAEAEVVEEFEELRLKFQAICEEVDSRRDEMKWLVQTLDRLIAHVNEEDAIGEQKKLEALIARYKSLLPSIEVTTVRVDTVTKCFIYKEEVQEVITWLKDQQETSVRDELPPTKKAVEELIDRQENVVQQLEGQRNKVLSTVQHGRDLQRDTNAPAFVATEATNLETQWKEVYQQATGTLHKLKSTKQVWSDYDEQKNEIYRLLKQAEEELHKMSETTEHPTLRKELRAKQELSRHLKETSTAMLQRLVSLQRALAASVSPEQRSMLASDERDIEKRLTTIVTTIEERIILLETITTKWSKCSSELDEFSNWINTTNQKLDKLKSLSMSPETKFGEIQVLRDEITEHLRILGRLEREGGELARADANSDQSRSLRTQLTDLRREADILYSRVNTVERAAKEEADHWNQYQTSRQEFEPWLAKAEGRLSMGHLRPRTIEEAQMHLEQSKIFQAECDNRTEQLERMVRDCDRVDASQNIVSDVDLLETRWQSVRDSVTQWVQEGTELVANWTELRNSVSEIQTWIQHEQVTAGQPPDVNTPRVERLQQKMEEIKKRNKQTMDYQLKVITASQLCERVCVHVDQNTAEALRAQVNQVKEQLPAVLETLRSQQATVLDAIAHRQDFQNRFSEFENGLRHLEQRMIPLNEVYSDNVEEAVETMKDIKQELKDLKTKFNVIRQEMVTFNAICRQEEMRDHNAAFALLSDQLEGLESVVESRELLFRRWLDFWSWHVDVTDRIGLYEQCIDAKNTNPEKVQVASRELAALLPSLVTLDNQAVEIETLMKQSRTVIKDRSTNRLISPRQNVSMIEKSVTALQAQMGAKEKHLEKVEQDRKEFAVAHNTLKTFLMQIKRQSNVSSEANTLDGLQHLLQWVQDLAVEMNGKQRERQALHEIGRSLMQADSRQYGTVQAGISEVDALWDEVNLLLADRQSHLQFLVNAWQNCNEMKREIESLLKTQVESAKGPENAMQAENVWIKAKSVSSAFAKQKPLVDQYGKRVAMLAQKIAQVPGFEAVPLQAEANELCQRWQNAFDKASADMQNLESQKVMWQLIEQSQEPLVSWLASTCSALERACRFPTEAATAKSILEKYKNELPSRRQLHVGLLAKMDSLENLNEDGEIPNLDSVRNKLKMQFTRAEELAGNLERTMENFSREEASVLADLQSCHAWQNSARERLAQIGICSGNEQQLMERLREKKKLGDDLQRHRQAIKRVEEKIAKVKITFEGCDISHLNKDLAALQKRAEMLESQMLKSHQNLLQALEKKTQTSLHEWQRWLKMTAEKVSWCKPDGATDRSSLQAKLSMLQAVKGNMHVGDQLRREFDRIATVLTDSDEGCDEVAESKEQLANDWETLKSDVDNTDRQLQTILDLWQKHDMISEKLSSWLRIVETKIHNETAALPEHKTAEPQLQEIIAEIEAHAPEFQTLMNVSEALDRLSPESRTKIAAGQLAKRHQAAMEAAKEYSAKLSQLQSSRGHFQDAVKQFQDWMQVAVTELRERSNISPTGDKPLLTLKTKLQRLKDLHQNKDAGQKLLTAAFSVGDSLVPTLSMEGREKIRSELRSLRNSWETYWDEVNGLTKKVEIALMQWDSFDDGCCQLENWLKEAETRISSSTQLMPTLHDKKVLLQTYKSAAQDVASHGVILQRLSERLEEFEDLNVSSTLKELQAKHARLSDVVQNRFEECSKRVSDHEAYQQNVEKFRDWMTNLQTECYGIQQQESPSLGCQLGSLEVIEKYKETGNEKLADLTRQLEDLLNNTHPSGHGALQMELQNLKEEWFTFLKDLKASQEKVTSLQVERDECEKAMADILAWLTNHESQAREIALKPSLEAKQLQLEKIKNLAVENEAKQKEVGEIVSRAKSVEGDSRLLVQAAQVHSRCQAVRNLIKDLTMKWEKYVRDHQTFANSYAESEKLLQEAEAELSQHCNLTGDVNTLNKRRTKLEELYEQKTDATVQLESVMECGEQLYPNTAPDGREVIRQQLKCLREKWDSYSEKLNQNIHSLDTCLKEFEGFTLNQEQLTRWLKEVERSMEQHTELKSNLQEKQAQFQNHKIVHQEILSHRPLIENVCDRARRLGQQTGDQSLKVYIRSIRKLYDVIVEKSKELLSKLEQCLVNHQQFLQQCKEFQDWMNRYNDQLNIYLDSTGDKAKISMKLEAIQALSNSQSKAAQMQEQLLLAANKVSSSSSPQGAENVNQQTKALQEAWLSCQQSTEKAQALLERALAEWLAYEKDLARFGEWIESTERELRETQLQATLEKKEQQLGWLRLLREKILTHETVVNEFSDKAHGLLQTSRVENVKIQADSFNTRFQALLVNSKDKICKWEIIVDNHKSYVQKLNETISWLTTLKKDVAAVNADLDIDERMRKLQLVMADKDRGISKLNVTTSLGERLYPETASPGRETIRQELRELRALWDEISAESENIEKQLETENQQRLQHNEGIQQVLNWLDVMEKAVQNEQRTWGTIQEAKAKLLRYQALQQDVLSRKRLIESICERSGTVPAMKETSQGIQRRYNTLCSLVQNLVSKLEATINNLREYSELQQSHSEWQKDMWDQVMTYMDYGDNKQALQSRLAKIKDVDAKVNQGESSLRALENRAEALCVDLTERSKEVIERELQSTRLDFEKLVSTIKDARHNLDSRLQQWNQYDEQFDRILRWLTDTETSLKEFAPKSTLIEKEQQLQKYQALVALVEAKGRSLQEFYNAAEILEQAILRDIQNVQKKKESLSDSCYELMQASGEVRLSVGIQQVSSRYQSLLLTCKEVVKKCEQHVQDHKSFQERFDECSAWLRKAQEQYLSCTNSSLGGDRANIKSRLAVIKNLLQEQASAMGRLSAASEMGEALYVSTHPDGQGVIRQQLQGLHSDYENFFDSLQTAEHSLQAHLWTWSGFDDDLKAIKDWVHLMQRQLGDRLDYHATLDDKKTQLQAYRVILHDILAHQTVIIDLKNKAQNLPDKEENLEENLNKLWNVHQELLQRAQFFVETYEQLVGEHQQYSEALDEMQRWLATNRATVNSLSDAHQDRISVQSNLERLRGMLANLNSEEQRMTRVKKQSDKVLAGSSETGQQWIQKEIDAVQQEWHSLVSLVKNLMANLEKQVALWEEHERTLELTSAWLRQIDTNLHAVDLKATLKEKQDQLRHLKDLQGEVHAKELEMDSLMERAHQLHNTTTLHRGSVVSEIGVRYQQVISRIKDFISKWQVFVNNHQEFENQLEGCKEWLVDIRMKLSQCSDLSPSSEDSLEKKLATIQNLLLYKEDGFLKIQTLIEQAQVVLANTATTGHKTINNAVSDVQEEWRDLALKMGETKSTLDDVIHKWAGFLEHIQHLFRTVEYLEAGVQEVAQLQATIPEKRTQLEKLKGLSEKVSRERMEVEILQMKADELAASGQQQQAAAQAHDTLSRFMAIDENLKVLTCERERYYKDHCDHKAACDDVINWINSIHEKLPLLTQSLGNRAALEAAVSTFEQYQGRHAEGQLKVNHMFHTGEVALASTSPAGQDLIIREMKSLQTEFEGLFKEINEQKKQLEHTLDQWRKYKEEYDRVSEWLQVMEAELKDHKTTYKGTVDEKQSSFNRCKQLLKELTEGQDALDSVNKLAQVLLTSHLDSYVNNQLRILNSRYQVIINLAKDVLKKVEQNHEHHHNYEVNNKKARAWIERARHIIKECSNTSGTRDSVQSQLAKIQDLIAKQDEGQALTNDTVNWGEKTLRNTRADCQEPIKKNIQELRTDWDRLVKKMSNAKVSLETSLLQWTDYSSSYKHLKEWLSEREGKLKEVLQSKGGNVTKGFPERKATLRKTNSLVQDIVSFEPVIESVRFKAEELLQKNPTSQVRRDATEIASKYEDLTKQARDIFEQQRCVVEKHEAFMDASNDFGQWLRSSRESLSKCLEAVGDREILLSKNNQVKMLLLEEGNGAAKLGKAVELGEKSMAICQEEERQLIGEEVAVIQEEFAEYKKSLAATKLTLEVALVRWSEYDEQFKQCHAWLMEKETEVQSYLKLQTDLDGKRMLLEKFQVLLQTIFDWQNELDKLNVKAQFLLETCSDSRISNAITQITSKYNALLSLAKEVMRRLEQYFQEHQQQQCTYTECVEWIDKTRERLDECGKVTDNLDDLNNKLQTLKNLKSAMEQGQHKLRYVLELKEKVILNTDTAGAAKIQENVGNLQQEFERLLVDIAKARQLLVNKISEVEDFRKILRVFSTWLAETEEKVKNDFGPTTEGLSERKATLEKLKAIHHDVIGHKDTAAQLRAKADGGMDRGDAMVPPTPNVKECISRYDNLQKLMKEKLESLTNQVAKLEDYNTAWHDANNWIMKLRLQIQEDCTGESKQTIEGKCKKHGHIIDQLDDGKALVDKAVELEEQLQSQMGPEGQERMKKNLEGLQTEWEGLNYLCKSVKQNLDQCLDAWNNFESMFNQQERWLVVVRAQVENEMKLNAEEKSENSLIKFKALLEDANNHKNDMAELSEAGETLVDLTGSNQVREQTIQLLSSYSILVATLEDCLTKVEKCVDDYKNYLRVKDEFNAWMQNCLDQLEENSSVKGNEDNLKHRLDALQALSARTSESQQLLHAVSEMGARALTTIPPDSQETLRNEITNMHRTWESFTLQLSQTVSRMKAALTRLLDFNQDRKKLEEWLKAMEEQFAKPMGVSGNAVEIKTQIEHYKHIQSEIETRGRDVDNIGTEAQELASKMGDESVNIVAATLKQRHESLLKKCTDLVTRLASDLLEFQEYHGALQETEKWMLHTSFQLMAHNSLYVNSLDQTQELMSQHEIVLAEVKSYQTTLDEVRVKGNGLIDRYQDVANNVCTEIQQQLTNIQESYEALLKSANQILKRLQDSCQKFREYEDTLDIINENMNAIEPELAKEQGVSPQSLEDARNHQNSARNICNKLNIEKQRLQVAIQCCEDATASLSRPSSPEAGIPSMIPEKETRIRLRLEDMIDQADNVQSTISRIVNEWEELERCREELCKWLTEQEAALVIHKSKPARLRPELAQAEISEIQYLKTQIEEKANVLDDIEQRQQTLSPNYQDTSLREQLQQLEAQATNLLELSLRTQSNIDDYRQLLSRHTAWYDQVIKQIEVIDRGDGLDSIQKAEKLKELLQEIEDQQEVLDELQSKVADIIPELGGMDAQQLEEQLKNTNKKCSELKKRVQRKIQVIEMIRDGADSISRDIFATQEWIKETGRQITEHPSLSHRSSAVETRIQQVNSVKRDVDAKALILETIEQRIETIMTDLEGYEKDHLRHALAALKNDFDKLINVVKDQLDYLARALTERQSFERSLATLQQWLQEKQAIAERKEPMEIQAASVEKLIDFYKKLDAEVDNYESSTYSDLKKRAKVLLQESPDKSELLSVMEDVQNNWSQLKTTIRDRLKALNDSISKRQCFESVYAKCKQWLSQVEVSLSADVRSAAAIHVFEEQLAKFGALLNEAANLSDQISELDQIGDELKSELSEANQLILQEQLDNIRDKYNRLTAQLRERVSVMEKLVAERRQHVRELEDCAKTLAELQAQLRALNRPIGHSVKDAQDALQNYQEVLKKLRDLQSRVKDLQNSSMLPSGEVEALLHQLLDSIQQADNQVAKLKQTILLRQHFHSLIADIETTIAKHSDVVNDVEKSEATANDKIRRYQEVLQKLTECDGNLVSAMDKGQQIGAEGSAVDRNFIMEQLQNLKMQLNELKRTIEKKKAEHEGLAAELNRLRQELEGVLDKLHAYEADVKSQPLLTLECTSVNEELRKHEILSHEVHTLLNKLPSIQKRMHEDEASDSFPVIFHELLSEAKLLAETLPVGLTDQETYLRDALLARQKYYTAYEQLVGWMELASTKLQPLQKGIDFENIRNDLQEHKEFFKESPAQSEHLKEVQKLALKIMATLTPDEQKKLAADLAKQEKRLQEILQLAVAKEAKMEKNAEIWAEFTKSIEKARLVLAEADLPARTVDSLPAVVKCLEEIDEHAKTIKDHEGMIKDLKSKLQPIEKTGDFNSKTVAASQLEELQQRWREMGRQAEVQRSAFQDIHDRWQKFVECSSKLGSTLSVKEQQLQALAQQTTTKAHLDIFCQQLKKMESEVVKLQSDLSNVHLLSSSVLIALPHLSEGAQFGIKEEVGRLTTIYAQLCESIRHKLRWIQNELSNVESLETEVKTLRIALQDMQRDMDDVDVYDPDQETVEHVLQQMKDHVVRLSQQVTGLGEGTRSRYASVQQTVPAELSGQLSDLEVLSESATSAMDDKERELKRARTMRYDYVVDVEFVQQWLQQAEVKLHDKSFAINDYKIIIEKLQSEIDSVGDRLTRINKNGQVLCERTHNAADKDLVRNTLAALDEQMQRVRGLLSDRSNQVKEALDAWKKFHNSLTNLRAWIEKMRTFLGQELQFRTLPATKEKLSEYQTKLKECPQMQHLLAEMGRETNRVAQICNSNELADKLADVESEKIFIEKRVQEQVALLQEMTEEWEQCEKKVQEVSNWLDKTKTSLDSNKQKKKPLREQFAIKEKMLAEVSIQRAKLLMSVEKLAVHLRNTNTADNEVLLKSENLQDKLEELQATLMDRKRVLEASISQIDQYQQEILRLKNQQVQAEHQLRVVSSPTFSPRDKKKQVAEQTETRQKMKQIQDQLTTVTERIKAVNQGRTPDPPLSS